MKLNSSPKIFENFKCDYPENTIKRIVEGFKKIGLNLTYFEKSVGSKEASIFSGYALIDELGSTQNGKGISSILSKASAYAEIVERFSTGFLPFRIPLPEKSSKYRKLLNDINERTFLKGYTRNLQHEPVSFQKINRYNQTKITKDEYESYKKQGLYDTLVEAFSFIENRTFKIPIHYIELKSTSNGLSSGNTYEEAIAQASFEIFERYAANKIIFEKIVCPTISLDSIKNEIIQDYLNMFESLKIEVIIKDFTLKNIVPVIGVLFINHNIEDDENILKKNRFYERINVGSHCNLYEAIVRCFTEYLQNTDKEELINRKKSDILYNAWTKDLGKKYKGISEEFKHFTRQYDYYGDLSFLKNGKKISFQNLKCFENYDCLNDVKISLEICKNNNWDMLFVDYTHKVLKFPTVRIIIPPISTDYDIFTKKCHKISSFSERFDFFYGIKDLCNYILEDSWIKDEEKIKKLIESIETFLSKELAYYQFYLTRENNFHQLVNLFHVLPYLYLSCGKNSQAKKYFEVLLKLGYHPPIKCSYFKTLYKTKYNPDIYRTHITNIEKDLKKNKSKKFELKENPFDPEKSSEKKEKNLLSLLDRINKSFSVEKSTEQRYKKLKKEKDQYISLDEL